MSDENLPNGLPSIPAEPVKPAAKPAAKPAKAHAAKVTSTLVSDERIVELRAKAKAKVDKERQAKAEAQLLEQFELEERRAGGVEEPLETLTIDLAEYCGDIRIDGVVYFQGQTYTVPRSRADVMREMMQKTWQHQAHVDGKSENFYRKSRQQHVGPPSGTGLRV